MFAMGFIPHPNYYLPSLWSHVEIKSVPCKFKAVTSWYTKKYHNCGISYNADPCQQDHKTRTKLNFRAVLREGKVESQNEHIL